MRGLDACVLVVATVSLWPSSALPCSCGRDGSGLAAQMIDARTSSSAVYRARVLSVEEGFVRGTARLEVLEVFKGPIKQGDQLTVPHGGGGDCTIGWRVGKTYLVYAGRSPTATHVCSRTREVSGDDVEQRWLRTGQLPDMPTALRRENVTCDVCTIESLMPALTKTLPTGNACDLGLDSRQAGSALSARRPFWTGGYYDRSGTGRGTAVGLSGELRPFEVIENQTGSDWRDPCRRRVTRRWCGSLVISDSELRCVGPSAEEVVCDEAKSRRSTVGPVEAFAEESCEWDLPSTPECKLGADMVAIDGGSNPIVMPCTNRVDLPDWYLCRLPAKP